MSLQLVTFKSFSAVPKKDWRLLQESSASSVFQSYEWLQAWWQVHAQGEPYLLTVWRSSPSGVRQLVGAGAFYLDAKRVLRFIGEDHADYGDVLLTKDDQEDILALLLIGLLALAPSRVFLQNVPTTSFLAQRIQTRKTSLGSRTPCPRVNFNKREAKELLAKESIRRHRKQLAARGDVEVRHLSDPQEIAGWMPEFFKQHIERWALTSTPSFFLSPTNEQFYSALVQGNDSGALLFTVVLLNGRAAAMHLGFRSQGYLIWYKPTFDPSLSAASPGEVLLAALIERAQAEGLRGLDFTRGDEAFKFRFASEVTEVANFEMWPSFLGRAFALASRAARAGIIRGLLALVGRPLLARIRDAQRQANDFRLRAGWRALFFKAWASCLRSKPHVLELFLAEKASSGALPEGVEIRRVTRIEQVLPLCNVREANQKGLLSTLRSRFATSDHLWLCLVSGQLAGYGWQTHQSPLPVTELDAQLCFTANTTLLYDFNVFPAYRKQGLYKAFLRAIRCQPNSSNLLIYAGKDNFASKAGILAAGFVYLGKMTRGLMGVRLDLADKSSSADLLLQSKFPS